MKKVSIIIPVFNVGRYIGDCLESLVNQTLKDIEIICVDDASTDNSLQIIKDYKSKDDRIKIIEYTSNKSASQARKDGVMKSDSEYILFLDGDDFLERNACEELYEEVKNHNVEILHFGTNIINAGGAPQKRIQNLEKLLLPYNEKLSGIQVFEGCFKEKKYRFTLWNKMYSASLCKKAFSFIKDGSFPKAQDLYAFFILCYFADSYYGIDKCYYNYRFGSGITGNMVITLEQLRKYGTSCYVAEAIEEFIINENRIEEHGDIIKNIRADLLNDGVSNWFHYLPDHFAAAGFDILTKYWKNTEIISNVCSKHYFERKRIAEKISGADILTPKKSEEIKTVGIFYYRLTWGGVQRVISILIPMYLEMGYKVVLFTDEYFKEKEYELPANVKRVVLPPSLTLKKDEYHQRAEIFQKELLNNEIDVLLYHASSSPKLIFDMMLIKMLGIPVILSVHEYAFQAMLSMNIDMVTRPSVFRLADHVSVLSKIEEKYWHILGVHAKYIPNPVDIALKTRDISKVENNSILWIGRLDFRTKQCMDFVYIMDQVVQEIPDAKLLVVGNEVTKEANLQLEEKIEEYQLQDNIILCGPSNDVGKYYERAAVHLLTSVSETFPMTIVESKAYGVPLVMYEIPYLEIVQDKRGFASVAQGDTKAMAQEIISLLKDKKYRETMGAEAQKSLIKFKEIDLKHEWKTLLENVCYNQEGDFEPLALNDKHLRIMMDSMLFHYNVGCKNKNKEIWELRKELKKANAKVKKTKNSATFRVGKLIVFIPRKIVRILIKIKKALIN